MASCFIRNIMVSAPPPCFLPMILHSPPDREEEEEEEEDGEEREEEEDSEVQEEEEEFLGPAPSSDMTNQLLRFADAISLDVQRYFGRCPDDPEACDIYTDRVTTTTSGRLRYYDDLVRMARTGGADVGEGGAGRLVGPESSTCGLGPLAELFDHCWLRSHSRPMNKRHLPISFWTEPIPCPTLSMSSSTHDLSNSHDNTHTYNNTTHTHNNTNTHTHNNITTNTNTHTHNNTNPDFSDLLAHWDPNPDVTHTLIQNTHTHLDHTLTHTH